MFTHRLSSYIMSIAKEKFCNKGGKRSRETQRGLPRLFFVQFRVDLQVSDQTVDVILLAGVEDFQYGVWQKGNCLIHRGAEDDVVNAAIEDAAQFSKDLYGEGCAAALHMADMLGGDVQFLGQCLLSESVGSAQLRDAHTDLLVLSFIHGNHSNLFI